MSGVSDLLPLIDTRFGLDYRAENNQGDFAEQVSV